MKKILTIFLSLLFLTACGSQSNPSIMKLTSSAFEHEGMIPALYTCDGDNISPPLAVADAPEDTESLVLIFDDPDSPSGTWVHWLVWNIKPGTVELPANSVATDSVEGMNSFKEMRYGGPCPQSGEHRYYFKLYALDTVLELAPESSKEVLEEAMQGHILDQTELMGKYSRSQS